MSTQHTYYRVAEATFAISLPEVGDVASLLPAFAPFRVEAPAAQDDLLFTVTAAPADFFCNRRTLLLEENNADFGGMQLYSDADGYQIAVGTSTGYTHLLHADDRFSRVIVAINWADHRAAETLSAMLRVVFSQAILFREGVALHAAAVCFRGRAFLFMGKSGTGKSTHAALWVKHFAGCSLLNDDNPTVRFVGGQWTAYGTPWSGKTPCYRNEAYPVAAIVRLAQAATNRFVPQQGVEAFVTVLPGCAAFPAARHLHDALCTTLVQLVEAIPVVGRLACRPDEAAARLCAAGCGEDVSD